MHLERCYEVLASSLFVFIWMVVLLTLPKGASWLFTYWLPWLEILLFLISTLLPPKRNHFLYSALCRVLACLYFFFTCLLHLWWLHLNLSPEKLTYILNQEGTSWFVLFKVSLFSYKNNISHLKNIWEIILSNSQILLCKLTTSELPGRPFTNIGSYVLVL